MTDLFEKWMFKIERAITYSIQMAETTQAISLTNCNMDAQQIAALIVDSAEGVKGRTTDFTAVPDKLHALTRLMLKPLAIEQN